MNVFKRIIDRIRGNRVLRYLSFSLTMLVALLAAAVVVSVTVDLGPSVRRSPSAKERSYIERGLHIGTLRIHLFTGKVLVEDLRIDGLHQGDRPFFTAKQIAVGLDWLPVFSRKPDVTITSVEMTDWQMLVEKWQDAHNFPKFTRDNQPQGQRRVHGDDEIPAGISRPVHLRGSRDAVERRLPQPRHQHGQPAAVSRHGDVAAAARWRSRTTCRCGRT